MTSLMVLTGMAAAQADSYAYPSLTLQTTDGTNCFLSTEALVITFADGQLVATNNDGTQSFDIASLSKMFFAEETTGIDESATASDGTVEAYTLGGVLMGRFASCDEAKTSLRSGVYVMKSKNQTKKISVK